MRHKRFGDLLGWSVSLIEGDDGAGGGTSSSSGDPAPNGGQDGAQDGSGDDSTSSTDQAPNGDQGGNGGGGTGSSGDDEVKKWKGHARTWETRSGEYKSAAEKAASERDGYKSQLDKILAAAGVGQEEDPAEAAKRIEAERDQAQAELRTSRIETAVGRACRAAGVDPDELLDRRSFAAEADKLDASAATLGDDAKAALEAYLEKYPQLKPAEPAENDGGKGRQQAAPSADMSGGGERPKSGPKTPDDFRKLRASGR